MLKLTDIGTAAGVPIRLSVRPGRTQNRCVPDSWQRASHELESDLRYHTAERSADGTSDARRKVLAPLHIVQDGEIYGAGETADLFYQVESGVVRTCKFHQDGRRQIGMFHVAGDLIGLEMGERYELSAEAVSDCLLNCYPREMTVEMTGRNGGLATQLFAYALQRACSAESHSMLLGRGTAVERVATFLAEWSEQCHGAATIKLIMTRHDIADYLGLTTETVSRMLARLVSCGAIEMVGVREIRIMDRLAFRTLCL